MKRYRLWGDDFGGFELHVDDKGEWVRYEDIKAILETKANAHLTAAAPDMYELLEQLRTKIVQEGIQDIVVGAMFSEEILLIDEVLQKARGE